MTGSSDFPTSLAVVKPTESLATVLVAMSRESDLEQRRRQLEARAEVLLDAGRKRVPVLARHVADVREGSFFDLGGGVFGWAAASEVSRWMSRVRMPHEMKPQIACMVIGADRLSRLEVSPRLAGLQQVLWAGKADEQVLGIVDEVVPDRGIVVDVNGLPCLAPLTELDVEWFRSRPCPGDPWAGYVAAGVDLVLSAFNPVQRGTRQGQRRRLLRTLTSRQVQGSIVRVDANGALVAISGGLLWGRATVSDGARSALWGLPDGGESQFDVLQLAEPTVTAPVSLRLGPPAEEGA